MAVMCERRVSDGQVTPHRKKKLLSWLSFVRSSTEASDIVSSNFWGGYLAIVSQCCCALQLLVGTARSRVWSASPTAALRVTKWGPTNIAHALRAFVISVAPSKSIPSTALICVQIALIWREIRAASDSPSVDCTLTNSSRALISAITEVTVDIAIRIASS